MAECSIRCIALSHRMAHIRWADSEISICRSRFLPACVVIRFVVSLSFSPSVFGTSRFLQARIVPRLIWGHWFSRCGHFLLARDQTRLTVVLLHSTRMCVRVSLLAPVHCGHQILYSHSGMFSQ